MKSGIVIINKEKGDTSQTVVSKVKRKLNIKKAGHIGTLDPLATGVLPVLIGDATKLSKYLIDHDKAYIATIKLGKKKDTGDDEGKVIQTAEIPKLEQNTVEKILNKMQGKQKQAPHKFSAVKINGKKLYEYARAGLEVDIPVRDIEIYSIKLLEFNQENDEITFEVACSKGTYIRVLCEDIAEKLGTVGYMKSLKRTKVAQFDINEATKLSDLTENNLIEVEKICKNYDKIELNHRKLELFLNGVMLTVDFENGIYRIYHNEKFIGLGIVEKNLLKRDVIIKEN